MHDREMPQETKKLETFTLSMQSILRYLEPFTGGFIGYTCIFPHRCDGNRTRRPLTVYRCPS